MLALLYDIHGNLPALDAGLADARGRGAGAWLLGGDVVAFGGDPVAVDARLAELAPATWIRGNTDRWLADQSDLGDGEQPMRAAVLACRAALGDARAGVLAALPPSAPLPAASGGGTAWHASPVSDLRSFLPRPGEDEGELLDGVRDPRLVFGHTHLPFRRVAAGGVELVNPGSVGLPFDGDRRAAYALVHPGGALELRRVAYDTEATIARLEEAFDQERAWVRAFAGRLRDAHP
jgi:predicted phosphodiesterase